MRASALDASTSDCPILAMTMESCRACSACRASRLVAYCFARIAERDLFHISFGVFGACYGVGPVLFLLIFGNLFGVVEYVSEQDDADYQEADECLLIHS